MFGGGGGATVVEHPEELLLELLALLLLPLELAGELSTYILMPWACCTCWTKRHAEWRRALHVLQT